VLQIKDRHNGNILLDLAGHIMHIDFGFLVSNAPGKGLKFENAPFKLSEELVEVLGAKDSKNFKRFRTLMVEGFKALHDNADKIILVVEMMMLGQSDLPCFEGGEPALKALKDRLIPGGKKMDMADCTRYVDGLIEASYKAWRTKMYDDF
jgi:phosphatidylinositol 4-kinase